MRNLFAALSIRSVNVSSSYLTDCRVICSERNRTRKKLGLVLAP